MPAHTGAMRLRSDYSNLNPNMHTIVSVLKYYKNHELQQVSGLFVISSESVVIVSSECLKYWSVACRREIKKSSVFSGRIIH
jgi:hypothetical protein